jgi:hypothetical protein
VKGEKEKKNMTGEKYKKINMKGEKEKLKKKEK